MTPAHERDLLEALSVSRAAPSSQLADFLYTHWFSRWRAQAPDPQAARLQPPIAATVRAAHAGTRRFEEGWTAISPAPQGGVIAERDGDRAVFAAGDHANLSRPAAPVRAGDRLAVVQRRDLADESAGWWYTWSAQAGAPGANDRVRLYWHAGSQALAPLLRALTPVLDQQPLPYLLKGPVQRALFGRTDAVVLYLEQSGWETLKPGLRQAHANVADWLDAEVPPLTLRLGRGAAAAEDPGDDWSFGQSRSHAVADGISAVREAGYPGRARTLSLISEALRRHGIDPDRPELHGVVHAQSLQPW
jgi:hypothetical protein